MRLMIGVERALRKKVEEKTAESQEDNSQDGVSARDRNAQMCWNKPQ